MRLEFLILEDDERRRNAMRDVLSDRFPQYAARFFSSAREMCLALPELIDAALLISLDDDFDPSSDHEPSTDPGTWNALEGMPCNDDSGINSGTGMDVAELIAAHAPSCPVVIHASNIPAANSMQKLLTDAAWTTERVLPKEDTAWIAESWFPLVRNAVVNYAGRYSKSTSPSTHGAR